MTNNLKNRILNTLQTKDNNAEIPAILKDLKKIQDKILKDYKNSNIDDKTRDELMKNYKQVEKIGKSLYRYNSLKECNITDAADKEAEKALGLVLKGGINKYTYVWKTEPNACGKCEELEGDEFKSEEEIPDPLHPNCKCHIEIKNNVEEDEEEEPCDCQARIKEWLNECEDACDEAGSIYSDYCLASDQLDEIISSVSDYPINDKQDIKQDIITLINHALYNLFTCKSQIVESCMIFKKNYDDLVNLKKELGHYLDQSAEYYHAKANCEAAQLGDIGYMTATILGYLREFTDFFKETVIKGYTIKQAFEDGVHDLEINRMGRKKGQENPDTDPKDVINPPKDLPEEFR